MSQQAYQQSSRGSSRKGRVRIIGGYLGSRILRFPATRHLRPTPARIRETLFNWLRDHVHQARVLDLFAGSGVLGFEALSRGAQALTLVERDVKTCTYLHQTITELGVAHAEVVHADAHAWLATRTPGEAYDLVFLDPPFDNPRASQTLTLLAQTQLLHSQTCVCCEYPDAAAQPWNDQLWQSLRVTRAGQTCVAWLQRTAGPVLR